MSFLIRGRSIAAIARLHRPYDEPRMRPNPAKPADSTFFAFRMLFCPEEGLHTILCTVLRSTSLLKQSRSK